MRQSIIKNGNKREKRRGGGDEKELGEEMIHSTDESTFLM